MTGPIRIPPLWLAEAKEAYSQYVEEWRREEIEASVGTGATPEEPQPWPDFFAEYLYAELENSVYVGTVNESIALCDE